MLRNQIMYFTLVFTEKTPTVYRKIERNEAVRTVCMLAWLTRD